MERRRDRESQEEKDSDGQDRLTGWAAWSLIFKADDFPGRSYFWKILYFIFPLPDLLKTFVKLEAVSRDHTSSVVAPAAARESKGRRKKEAMLAPKHPCAPC